MPEIIWELESWVKENYNAPACEWTYIGCTSTKDNNVVIFLE